MQKSLNCVYKLKVFRKDTSNFDKRNNSDFFFFNFVFEYFESFLMNGVSDVNNLCKPKSLTSYSDSQKQVHLYMIQGPLKRNT